jgi:hypothetical protein
MRRTWETPVRPGEFWPSLQPGHCEDYWDIAVWVPGDRMIWARCPFMELDVAREMLRESGLIEVEVIKWGYSCPRISRPLMFRPVDHARR